MYLTVMYSSPSDVDREQVHVAPEDVADILELFVKYDVAAFEQRVHRVAHDIDGTVALGRWGCG